MISNSPFLFLSCYLGFIYMRACVFHDDSVSQSGDTADPVELTGLLLPGLSIPTWPGASTTWRASTATKASTGRLSPFTSGPWRFRKRPWALSIPTWPPASTTWRNSTAPRAATPMPNPSTSGRWRSTKRRWRGAPRSGHQPQQSGVTLLRPGPLHRRGAEPQQPGDALPQPRPVREGRAAFPAVAGDPGKVPGAGAPRRGHLSRKLRGPATRHGPSRGSRGAGISRASDSYKTRLKRLCGERGVTAKDPTFNQTLPERWTKFLQLLRLSGLN
jgi:hypothetical protein